MKKIETVFDKSALTLDRGAQAVKDVVTAIRNSRRAGTASTKSFSFLDMKSSTSSRVCFLAYESGSSPSGINMTLTSKPSFRNMSIPLKAACTPASSPSYIIVTLRVNLLISRICPSVNAVPLEATTLVIPSWCMERTSK